MSLNHVILGNPNPLNLESADIQVDGAITCKGSILMTNQANATASKFKPATFLRFIGRDTNGTATIISSNDITSVTRTAVGKYEILFDKEQETDEYLVSCTCGISGIAITTVTETHIGSCKLEFYSVTLGANAETALADPFDAHVIIMN